jgi:hypothetical protein
MNAIFDGRPNMAKIALPKTISGSREPAMRCRMRRNGAIAGLARSISSEFTPDKQLIADLRAEGGLGIAVNSGHARPWLRGLALIVLS